MHRRCTRLTSKWSTTARGAQSLLSDCTAPAQNLTHEKPMNLVPVRPPGSNARKARTFAPEILRLRAQGYTFEAIREALAGAGIHVSNSTVQREVARAARGPTAIPPEDTATSHRDTTPQPLKVAAPAAAASTPTPPAVPQDRGARRMAGGLGGKASAEAFFTSHECNPLFPTKETP